MSEATASSSPCPTDTLIRPSDAHGLGPGDRLAPRLALTVEIGKRVAADVFKSGQRAA